MKKIKSFLLFLFVISAGCLNVKAANSCAYKEQAELNKAAGQVKTNYEVVETEETIPANENNEIKEEHTVTNYSFSITIYNITKDIYIEQTNDLDNTKEVITFDKTTDGKYTFTSTDLDNIITYKISVLSNLENCAGKNLNTYSFVKPKYNYLSDFEVCQNNNAYYCKRFVTKEVNVTESELVNKIYNETNHEAAKKDETNNNFISFLKNNYLYIIGGVVLIGGAVVAIVIVRKKGSAL